MGLKAGKKDGVEDAVSDEFREQGNLVNVWAMLRSTDQDSISLVACVEPLVGFRPADRHDLHHTSPGDDGRTDRNFAVPKHTSMHSISALRCPLHTNTNPHSTLTF